ncbi:MAG: hypothetical protein WC114_02745 [Smithellaceae bacterium]|jgi:hypothetical protein
MPITKPTSAEIKAEIERVTNESRTLLRHLRALLRVTECGEKKDEAKA